MSFIDQGLPIISDGETSMAETSADPLVFTMLAKLSAHTSRNTKKSGN